MANKLRFSPTVPEELRGAIDSYEVVSVQLGNRIRRAFHELFQMIKENPELYAIVYDNIRIARQRRIWSSTLVLRENEIQVGDLRSNCLQSRYRILVDSGVPTKMVLLCVWVAMVRMEFTA